MVDQLVLEDERRDHPIHATAGQESPVLRERDGIDQASGSCQVPRSRLLGASPQLGHSVHGTASHPRSVVREREVPDVAGVPLRRTDPWSAD
jgi:hypothetical protein